MLERVKGFSTLGLKPMPNQVCAWAISNSYCRAYFAVPVASGSNAIRQLAPTAPEFMLKRFPSALGEMLLVSNRNELLWSGLPWILPNLRAYGNGDGEWVVGSVFPLSGQTIPPPDELYAQVRGRTNLVYYDWEETPQRLDHSRQLYQLACIVDRRPILSTNSLSERWLLAIRPKLGNAATEITQTGPQELTLLRKSQLGFTGFELATFGMWLESPGFPFRFELPPGKPRTGTNSPPTAAKNP
jgi:hypothetical protein